MDGARELGCPTTIEPRLVLVGTTIVAVLIGGARLDIAGGPSIRR